MNFQIRKEEKVDMDQLVDSFTTRDWMVVAVNATWVLSLMIGTVEAIIRKAKEIWQK